ncbi:MAG: phosphopentomutase, partial [Nitrospirae bacterium]|nr:phosphopentomutase [Nitrospirota bacterium]
DIFAGRGFTKSVLVSGNNDAVSKTITYFESLERGLVWVTLVDFDTLYGHRNDPQGYAKALKDFDKKLPEILEMLTERDILIITADHGCDPTTPSTDHSREYVPLLIYGNALKKCVNLGLRTSFSDLGATALEALGIKAPVKGKSFWEEIIDRKNTL